MTAPLYYNKTLNRLPLHFKMNNQEINDYFVKYIDSGVHIGKEHIFNDYGVCILSNVLKTTIQNTAYNIHDFNKLRYTVYEKIYLKKEESKIKDEEMDITIVKKEKLNYKDKKSASILILFILDVIKGNKKLTILRNMLNQINKNILNDEQNKNEIKWATIITQTKLDINALLKGLGVNKKELGILTEKLINLANFENLHEENISKTNFKKAEQMRNIRKEKELVKMFNYLNSSILLIKNKKIKFEKKLENIRNQYQYLYSFKDEEQLFSNMMDIINNYKDIFKYVRGQKDSFITKENIGVLFHYLLYTRY